MTKRKVGKVSLASGGGAGAGYAAAQVIVWALAQWSIDAAEIVEPLGLLLTVAGALLGGYLVKPRDDEGGKHAA